MFKSIIWGYILGFILLVGFSWLFTIGVIKLITLCFGITFNVLTATGIWLILWFLGSIFGNWKK